MVSSAPSMLVPEVVSSKQNTGQSPDGQVDGGDPLVAEPLGDLVDHRLDHREFMHAASRSIHQPMPTPPYGDRSTRATDMPTTSPE